MLVCLFVCLFVYHSAAKLIVAHARGDKDEVVRLHFARAEQGGMGTVTKRMNSEVGQLQLLLAAVAIVLGNSIPSLRACPRQVGYLFSSFYHDRDSDDVTGGTAPSHIVHIGKPRAGPPCSPVQPPPGQANEHSPGSARAAAQRLPIAKESFRRCGSIKPRPECISSAGVAVCRPEYSQVCRMDTRARPDGTPRSLCSTL